MSNLYIQQAVGQVTVIPTDLEDDSAGFDIYYDSTWANGDGVKRDRQTLHVTPSTGVSTTAWAAIVAAADPAVHS